MNLTEKQISDNKERFLNLINSITRDGVKKEALINQLTYSDFFTAPASTRYHGDFKGGLCFHSLNVYDALVALTKIAFPFREIEKVNDSGDTVNIIESTCPYSDETLKIVALLHDLSKMKFYTVDIKNKKQYAEDGTGSKKEFVNGECKTYDWVSEPYYRVKDFEDRFIFGNHQETALFMVQAFIPLEREEAAAILNHMGIQPGMTPGDATGLSEIYTRYPLAAMLHTADHFSTFISDKNESHN